MSTRIANGFGIGSRSQWHWAALKKMERAVERGQRRKERRVVARLGVDEKSIAKGHTYFTVTSDLDGSTVE